MRSNTTLLAIALATCAISAGCESEGLREDEVRDALASEPRSVLGSGAIRPGLYEERTGIGTRGVHAVAPGLRVGADGRPRTVTVDEYSSLRLVFAPVAMGAPGAPGAMGAVGGDASSAGELGDASAPDFGRSARAIEDLADRLASQEAELATALGQADRAAARAAVGELAAAVAGTTDAARDGEHRRAIAVARQVDAAARERVLVEAFRVTNRSRMALALPGYNEIGAGRVANELRPAATFGDTSVRDSAAKLAAACARLAGAVDRLRARVDELAGSPGAGDPELWKELLAYKTALTARLEALLPVAGEPTQIARGFSDLPSTEIDLSSNGFERGDVLRVSVSTVRETTGADGSPQVGTERDLVASWVASVGRIGWHRTDSLFGILARGGSGGVDATNWELSFAGGVTWSWYQDDEQPLGSAYSWFQPGFGLHLAALDQDAADDVEVGIGAHVALWEGLVILGAGANLSVDDDQTYYLIGGDLFGWTDKITGAVK